MTETRERAFHEMPEAECWEMVRSHVVGRLAVATDDGGAPVIAPVNYVVDGTSVVFRSAVGLKLAMLHGRPVSFEVDHIDVTSATGWSVLLRGRAHELTHWEADHLDIETWAPGDRRHFVRVVPEAVTGRRITPAAWIDERGYL